jgi:hypothetical protein
MDSCATAGAARTATIHPHMMTTRVDRVRVVASRELQAAGTIAPAASA